MFDCLFCKEQDDKKVLLHNGEFLTFSQLKALANKRAEEFAINKSNCIFLNGKNNFDFIIDFIAAVLSKKEIFLTDENTNLEKNVANDEMSSVTSNQKYSEIIINLCTSGSQGEAKLVKKSLYNLIKEAEDIGKTFFDKTEKLMFVSTTTLNHLFGLTFHFMVPFVNGFIIDTKSAAYPENVCEKDTILVTSPSFLEKIKKYSSYFKTAPNTIITAGAKLKDEVFEYFEKKSRVIEIYGSTETGVIAHRENSNEKFLTKFSNVSVVDYQNNIMTVKTEYSYNNIIELSDNVLYNSPDKIKVLSRIDRIMKIGEKRISPQTIENLIVSTSLAEDALCLKIDEKLAAAIVLSDEAKKLYLQIGYNELTKKFKHLLSEKVEIVPQKWRFLPELYKTKTGKIDKDKIEEIFSVNISFPLILNQKVTSESAEFELIFPNHSNFFKGHFEGFPIVPGVVELYFAVFFANQAFNNVLDVPQTVKKLKFSNLIKPDEKVSFLLFDKEKSIDFIIKSQDNICASGLFSKSKYFEMK